MTGGLCITMGSMLTCKTVLCAATVKFILDLLEGGHQSFSCSSPSGKEKADRNCEPNGLAVAKDSDYCTGNSGCLWLEALST